MKFLRGKRLALGPVFTKASAGGSGTAKIVEDTNEKKIALERILKKYGFSEESAYFRGETLEKTCVIKIEVKQISDKAHAYGKL